MVIENNRLREENILMTAKEDGREEGKENKTLEIIQNMLAKGTDYEYISEITGKTIDEIKEIESNVYDE